MLWASLFLKLITTSAIESVHLNNLAFKMYLSIKEKYKWQPIANSDA